MGKDELRKRDKWQTIAGRGGRSAEDCFQLAMTQYFEMRGMPYELIRQPSIFKSIYNQGKKVKGKVIGRHGIKIDFQIKNQLTDKSVFVEVKRQDKGRGNAHERACKFFTPGLLKIGREKGNISDDHFPYVLVFSNGIAHDKKRIEEISYWFRDYPGVVFFWKKLTDYKSLINHFESHIWQLLE